MHASSELAPSATSSHHVRAGGSESGGFQPWCLKMGFAEAASPGLSGAGAAPGRSWRLSPLPLLSSRRGSLPPGPESLLPPPATLPPISHLSGCKTRCGLDGESPSPAGKGGRCLSHSTRRSRLCGPSKAGLGGRGCGQGVPTPGTAWAAGRTPPRLSEHPGGSAGAV